MGHAGLQLRPQRSAHLPDFQRPLLAQGEPHRRAAGGCGGLHAVPGLFAQGGRVAAQPVRRQRKSGGHRFSAALQRAGAPGAGRLHGGGRIHRVSRRFEARLPGRPRLHHEVEHGAPAWGDAGVVVPWTMYKMYGDRAVLERNYRPMTAWMDFLASRNPDRLRAHQLGNNYGDWLAPKGDFTPSELIGTAYWAYDAGLMAEISRAIGRSEDAAYYEDLVGDIREAFAKAFVDRKSTRLNSSHL